MLIEREIGLGKRGVFSHVLLFLILGLTVCGEFSQAEALPCRSLAKVIIILSPTWTPNPLPPNGEVWRDILLPALRHPPKLNPDPSGGVVDGNGLIGLHNVDEVTG